MRKIKRFEIQPVSTAERGIEMCAMRYSACLWLNQNIFIMQGVNCQEILFVIPIKGMKYDVLGDKGIQGKSTDMKSCDYFSQ